MFSGINTGVWYAVWLRHRPVFCGQSAGSSFQWRVDIGRWIQKEFYQVTAVAPSLIEPKSFPEPEHEASLVHAIHFTLQYNNS